MADARTRAGHPSSCNKSGHTVFREFKGWRTCARGFVMFYSSDSDNGTGRGDEELSNLCTRTLSCGSEYATKGVILF